jgi:hypothetical protein
MKLNTLIIVPILSIITLGSLMLVKTQADWDNSQYITYRGDQYLQIGTGNLGLTYDLQSFTSPDILNRWLYKPSPNEFDIKANLTTRLSAIDFIHGVTEGNISYNKITKKWILTNYFPYHIEPSGSGRKTDNLGAFNTGLTSTNCYIDRPVDTVLNPLCDAVFKNKGTNESSVGSLSNEAKRDFFYDNQLTLLLSNYKALTIRKNAKLLMDHINSEGMGNQSTSIKLFYIDQINQLGLEGAKRLVTLDKKYKNYTRDNLLVLFKQNRIIDNNDIAINRSNGEFNFKKFPTDIVRLIFARTQFFNAVTENSDRVYDTKQQWIIDLSSRNKMSQQQLMAGDALRRYLLLPQSIQEFNDMEQDGYRMEYDLKRIFKAN